MAKDAELDRLKSVQDAAFARKQRAFDAQDAAWKRRSSAGDTMNRAYEAMNRAYEAQQTAWQNQQRIRDHNGPQIDRLNTQQETAFQNMKRAFDNASAAHDRREGASARSYADEGHRHKEESRRCVEERRRLVAEIRAAKAPHQDAVLVFQRAKAEFESAKRTFNAAKAEHSRHQTEFKAAKAAFDQAAKDFKARLDKVKAESSRKREDKRALAEKAGVPFQYRDDVWVSTDSSGNTNLYFGGAGKANGPGHGHYVLDRNGTVTYKRDPYDPHGNQNFVRDAQLENRMAQIALSAYHRDRSSVGPRSVQYDDGMVTVKVKSGYHGQTNTVATDVIVIDRINAPNEHYHVIYSEHDGSVLFSEWRINH